MICYIFKNNRNNLECNIVKGEMTLDLFFNFKINNFFSLIE